MERGDKKAGIYGGSLLKATPWGPFITVKSIV